MNTVYNKISHHAQVGGIETSVLDNGAGRGNRIAWINTGTGFRFKVLLDRGMDIGEAFFNEHGLAWLGSRGFLPPQFLSDKGIEWLRTFGGGLLTTCGLSHVGPAETDERGERGLHGAISNIPAEIESIVQPDPAAGRMEFSITGNLQETRIFGPNLHLRRTISGTLGNPSIHLRDEVINRGNTTVAHMVLYHFNFGWPLADEGTEILWRGAWKPRDGNPDNRIFNSSNNYKRCPAPYPEHNGAGEDVAIIDAEAEDGVCSCGLYNRSLQLAVALRFQKSQLPWLTNWQHWAVGEYVTGLEPGTNPPVGQNAARKMGQLLELRPGESKTYELSLEVLHTSESIKTFVDQLTKA